MCVCVCVGSDQRLHCAQVFDLVPAQVEVGQVRTLLSQSVQRTRQVVVAQFQLRKHRGVDQWNLLSHKAQTNYTRF